MPCHAALCVRLTRVSCQQRKQPLTDEEIDAMLNDMVRRFTRVAVLAHDCTLTSRAVVQATFRNA